MSASMRNPELARLSRSARAGWSLPQGFYLRPDVYETDLRLLGDRWTLAGHQSQAAEPGDWFTVELGADSAIIVRGEDGTLRALANVCPHRGSRICTAAQGSAALFTCPYHAWSFRLDGSLRAAREMKPDFDPRGFDLAPLPITVLGGLVFISFGANPPDLTDAGPRVAQMGEVYGWDRAKVAARKTYSVSANWKLVMENYHECYHCAPSHPEFAALHALARPNNRVLSPEPDAATGLSDTEEWGPAADGKETVRVMRSLLSEGVLTGSLDGGMLAPPMGAGGARKDGQCVFGELGLISAFLAYGDHGVLYRFIPRAPLRTDMEVIWIVDDQAREGVDYDLERLTWLWDVTSLADKTIIEDNQAGVSSRAYRPGPFSMMEPGTEAYVARYVAEFANAVGA